MKEEKLHEDCIFILKWLFNQRRIGGKHTPIDYCLKRINYINQKQKKRVLKDLRKCIKKELILEKKKPNKIHYSLNPRKMKEIKEIIKCQENGENIVIFLE